MADARLMAADAPKIERGEAVALVLGAGGARGFAQIGVVEALQSAAAPSHPRPVEVP